MSYDFSFNKKMLSFLLVGCAFVGILLFVAGLIVGANWKTEPAPVTTAAGAGGQQAATPPPAQATAPQTTVPKEPALQAETMPPKTPNSSEAVVPNAASVPVRQAHQGTTGVESRRELAAPAASEDDGGVKIIQRAETPASETAERPLFSIQIGVFTKESDAQQLVRQLQRKGYSPFILTANDDGDRVLYAVRVGAYTNLAEATQSASDFTQQEKMQTMVCPLDSLRCTGFFEQGRKK